MELIFALSLYVIQPPPARFDHPYRGQLRVIYADGQRFTFECVNMDPRAVGCAERYWAKKPKCKIVIRSSVRGDKAMVAQIMRHEIGHCNGWPGNHPR